MESPLPESHNKIPLSTEKKLAFLTALCLFFSAVEFAIPKPLPFLRLGLANLPVILSLFILTPLQTLILIALKIFVQNLISGTLFSYTILFSITGSFASGIIMLLLFRLFYVKPVTKGKIPLISLVGISLSGSLFNALGQLLVSYFLIFQQNTKYIAPVLLGLSLVTGLLLGLFTENFCRKSEWLKLVSAIEVKL